MADKPPITWIGSPNFGFPDGAHGGNEPEAIVYHIAQGSMTGMDAWFNNPRSEVSAHFAVGKNGTIHQYVDPNDPAWGNGLMNKPDLRIPWLRKCFENGINPNTKTISIEHEGFTGQPWTEAMYRSSFALTKWLIETYRFRHALTVLDHGFIGHYRIDSVNRRACPGTGWPRLRLFSDLRRLRDVYVPRDSTIYWRQTFNPPASGVRNISINVGSYGYPSQASAVELFLGCRSLGDGAFVVAYDGVVDRLDKASIYPTAPLRNDWQFGRGRVQLSNSRFLLKIGHAGDHPVEVFAILKGYYTLD